MLYDIVKSQKNLNGREAVRLSRSIDTKKTLEQLFGEEPLIVALNSMDSMGEDPSSIEQIEGPENQNEEEKLPPVGIKEVEEIKEHLDEQSIEQPHMMDIKIKEKGNLRSSKKQYKSVGKVKLYQQKMRVPQDPIEIKKQSKV